MILMFTSNEASTQYTYTCTHEKKRCVTQVFVKNATEKQVLNGLSDMNVVEQKRYRKCPPCISAEKSIQNE